MNLLTQCQSLMIAVRAVVYVWMMVFVVSGQGTMGHGLWCARMWLCRCSGMCDMVMGARRIGLGKRWVYVAGCGNRLIMWC